MALNPRMTLYGDRSLGPVLLADRSLGAFLLYRERLGSLPWAVYRVCRIYPAKGRADGRPVAADAEGRGAGGLTAWWCYPRGGQLPSSPSRSIWRTCSSLTPNRSATAVLDRATGL